jgi:hypothetical protein
MIRQDLLRPALLALSALFLVWNIVLAGRITRQRSLPPVLGLLTALGGLLVLPAFLMFVASASVLTGRPLSSIAWVWPITATLIAAQAFYATAARFVTPIVGVPILIYDIVATAAALGSYLLGQGEPTSFPLAALVAGWGSAVGWVAGPAAIAPLYGMIPILSPAHPARWRAVAGWRLVVALVALGLAGFVGSHVRRGARAITTYDELTRYELRPRPGELFAVGLEILPPIESPPTAFHLRSDLDLIGTAALKAVMVDIPASGVRAAALDSIRRVLDPFRRDSLLLIAAVRAPAEPEAGASTVAADSAHRTLVEQVARRLSPDYLLPLDEPPAGRTQLPTAASAMGLLARRKAQLIAVSERVRRIDPRIRLALSVTPGGSLDSALYAWAISAESPVEVLGFSLLADEGGGSALAERIRTAERWMLTAQQPREHWVFHAGGLPAVHGERSQEAAIAGLIGWAMGRPEVRGVIVTRSGDYDDQRGLRAASGRMKAATAVLVKAGQEAR